MSDNNFDNSSYDRVIIFDTTLRDGEQSPGASMDHEQKLQIATALKDLGVDVIELGFPVASPGDFAAVQNIARQVEGPTMCALARCNREDIDRTWEALKDNPRPRLHIFLATSPLHRQYKLNMSKEEVLKRSVEAVKYAREHFNDVEFSCEDAARTELDYLTEVVENVIAAGATTINIPDTVGYALPQHFAGIISHLKKSVRGIDKAVLSVHCHNDLGLAVANSLAAVIEGARQVECTINGIGERAGNCALEEVVMAMRTRHDILKVRNQVRTPRLYPTSRLLSNVTGLHVQRNKAIVGQNAFAHEAGIHQHGVMMNAATYEIMKPEDVGFSSNNLVLGKHSGRHLLRQKVKDLGYHLENAALDRLFEDVKKLADRKKELYDADLEGLIQGYVRVAPAETYELVALNSSSATGALPTASVVLNHSNGSRLQFATFGDGPIDAIFKCIETMTRVEVSLRSFEVSNVTKGEDAQGQITVEVEHEKRRYRGRAVNTDIIEGSARAFLNAINRVLSDAPASEVKNEQQP
jgi:2-isopropylmalate synthase